ncbi:MAG TPA: response regulator, partial [Verrucomicrobiota bacterium]|nr:response regulator [Verrucomicrobiota bacterium]
MKTLLVLAPHPELAEALRAGLSPDLYRIVHRVSADEAEPLLAHGLVNACIVDVELSGVQEIWILEKLRRRAPRIPILVYAKEKQREWEEEAYLQGATYVLTKPVRMRMLTALLDRLWRPVPEVPAPAEPAVPRETVKPVETAPGQPALQPGFQSLSALRGFSAILTHSLDADAMLRQFLLMLRELVGINRAAVFLHQPPHWPGERATAEQGSQLRAASAIGLSPGLLEHFELSLESGIGGMVSRLGRILRRSSDEARRDVETQKEFELLG